MVRRLGKDRQTRRECRRFGKKRSSEWNGLDTCEPHLCPQSQRVRNFCDTIGVPDEFNDFLLGGIRLNAYIKADILRANWFSRPISMNRNTHIFHREILLGGLTKDIVAVAAAYG